MTSECFIIFLHKKKAVEMFLASEGWIRIMKIYPNIIVETGFFKFLIQGKLIALKYGGEQLIS